MAVRERPASRIRDLGAQALSTAELVTLAMGATDLETGHTALAMFDGSLRAMAQAPMASLSAIINVGPARTAALYAALEIGRRMACEARAEHTPVRSPRDVVALIGPRMEDLTQEEFRVIILDAQHRAVRDVLITRGILNSSLVHPREVFRAAIADHAAAIILVHNHPSGDPAPSVDDRNITEQLVAAGRLLDIPIHDHVIIGRGRYTSFAEAGILCQ
jgi:DNA repair protein RadC